MTDREPITDKLPRVGRVRAIDVEFLEFIADIAAAFGTIRVILAAQPGISKEAIDLLSSRENAIVQRFDRLLSDLAKGE